MKIQAYQNRPLQTNFKGFQINNYKVQGTRDFFVELGKELRAEENKLNIFNNFDLSEHAVQCIKKMKKCAYDVIIENPVFVNSKGIVTPSIKLINPKGEVLKTVMPESGLIIDKAQKKVTPKAVIQIENMIDEALRLDAKV